MAGTPAGSSSPTPRCATWKISAGNCSRSRGMPRPGVPPPGPFTSAVVGSRDRIMPPENQLRYWQGVIPCRTVNLPHLPFSRPDGVAGDPRGAG